MAIPASHMYVCVCVRVQVGVAACQLSRALGLKVLGTAGTPEGMKLVLNNGAHRAFNHREEGYTDKIMVHIDTCTHTTCRSMKRQWTVHELNNMNCVNVSIVFQEATEGRGVDVIVEMLSNVNLSKDLQMLAYGGRVAVSRTVQES